MFASIAWISLGVAFLCALVIAVDEMRRPQAMWIMNLVWPITALYLGVFALWGYFRIGRGMTKSSMHGGAQEQMQQAMKHGAGASGTQRAEASGDPNWRQVAVSDSHCGAGCVLGDVVAEFGLFALGWTLFGEMLYAEFAGDLLLAWLFGIFFQYFVIAPMRHLSLREGLIAAIKSDTLSILTFEIGLFGWMALTYFVFFPGPRLQPTQAGYWFMMQIGMALGFLTSYPMNRWLIKAGWKEAMG